MARPRRLNESGLPDLITVLPEGPLVIALSGGADSAACAWAAVEAGRSVRGRHIVHGRPSSERLEVAARSIAEHLGITLEVERIDPINPFTEEAAREARYARLIAGLNRGEWLVTGHTADDVAETVVMNLARGAGLDGISGIPSQRQELVRPMLSIRRSETREIATLAGLGWFDDPDNEDLSFLRNRVRLDLLRSWEETFGASAIDGLVRTALLAAREVSVLDVEASRILPRQISPGPGVAFVRGELIAAGPVIAGRAIRHGLRPLLAGRAAASRIIDAVMDVAAGRQLRSDLGSSWVASVNGSLVEIARTNAPHPPSPEPVVLEPGTVQWGDWSFETTVGKYPDVVPLSPTTMVLPRPVSDDPTTAVVRGSRPEDGVAVPGGHASVANVLAKARVPRRYRAVWPVVALGERIVWIPGVRRLDIWSEGELRSKAVRSGSTAVEQRRYLWIQASRGNM